MRYLEYNQGLLMPPRSHLMSVKTKHDCSEVQHQEGIAIRFFCKELWHDQPTPVVGISLLDHSTTNFGAGFVLWRLISAVQLHRGHLWRLIHQLVHVIAEFVKVYNLGL